MWFRDLAAMAVVGPVAVQNSDCLAELRETAADLEPGRARRAAELVQDTRRRLDLNVSEELALEALTSRLERVLS
jgi:DNA polymerase-3 subunit delta'